MTYPNGRVVGYNYAAGLDSTISRLSSITDSGVTLESYSYLGLGTVVVRAHPQNGVDLSYVKLTGEAVGDAGDQYTGLDRFGRIVDQRWRAGSVDKDRNQYTYDRDGNRLTKVNSLNSAFNEVYTYDGLNQVASFNRGSGARTQSFDYDALGNRDGVTTNGSTQTYTANKQNEITSISGATTPTYDANGNMTGDETGKLFVYDAWNRLVAVKNSGGTVLKTYGYDALNHRMSETVSGTTTDLYYSAGWQVLEERVGGVTRVSNVWSPVYVDAMVARDRDTDANGTLDERLYVTHDANFNVTGLVNTIGAVVERYVYDTYGAVTVLNASWTVLGGSAYAWVYLHQGGRVDAVSGLVHFRNRDYSVTLGRWVTMDPIRYGAGDVDLYRAVGNGMPNRVDPSGLAPGKTIKKFAGGEAEFKYEVYDAELVFLVGHVSTAFPATGDLILTAQHVNDMLAEALKVNKNPATGASKLVGMSVSFNATLKCGEDPKDYEWVQQWKRSYVSRVPFEKGQLPESLKFPAGWMLDRAFGAGVLSFKDKPGFATALAQIDGGNINEVTIDKETGAYTINRPNLDEQEQGNLSILFKNSVVVKFEFEIVLNKKGNPVATFKWGFDFDTASKNGTYSGLILPHKVV